jgi:hypothetical protein
MKNERNTFDIDNNHVELDSRNENTQGYQEYARRYCGMKKFDNMANKINAIKGVFKDGEKLKGKDIVSRLHTSGYRVRERNVLMFIYHRMLYKYLRREVINGINVYTLT